MKLLRLRSEQSTLNYKGDLDTNFILPPKSKIGLKNVSFNKLKNEIDLTDADNIIATTIGTGNDYIATLPTYKEDAVTYTQNNIDSLSRLMEDYMNSELVLTDGLVIGGAWRLNVDSKENKLDMVFEQNPKVNIVQSKIGGYTQSGVDDTVHTAISKTSGVDDLPNAAIGVLQSGSQNYECFASKFRTLTNKQGVTSKVAGTQGGCGFVRCQIGGLDATGSGFFIGLSPLKLNQFNGNFAIGRFQYAIYAKNTASNYEFMNHTNAGSPSTGSFAPAVNDVLELALSDGVMKINVYSTTHPTGREVFTGLNIEKNDVLYPYLVFYTKGNNVVSSYEFTPLNPSPTDTLLEAHDLTQYNGNVTPPIQELYSRLYELDWSGFQPWYKYLGFNDLFESNEVVAVSFFSDQPFNFVDDTECYLVLVDNYAIDSYDMAPKENIKIAGGQKSILAVIQNTRNKTDDNVLFEESNPIMIDLDNANSIMFKNLNISIVTEAYLRAPSTGFGNMCCLLD